MKNLTSAQRDELIEQFVEIQLDNMDTQSLYELASEYVTNSFDRLKERVDCYDEDGLFDELIDNVTSKPDVALLTLKTDNLPDISDNEADGVTE